MIRRFNRKVWQRVHALGMIHASSNQSYWYSDSALKNQTNTAVFSVKIDWPTYLCFDKVKYLFLERKQAICSFSIWLQRPTFLYVCYVDDDVSSSPWSWSFTMILRPSLVTTLKLKDNSQISAEYNIHFPSNVVDNKFVKLYPFDSFSSRKSMNDNCIESFLWCGEYWSLSYSAP